MTARLSAIDFTLDLEKLTKDFTGRQWVFDDIDRWLRESDERFFILTGEPGVGKSAIAAQLTQIRQDIAAYHFCIAGRSSTIEPNNVLLSLSDQLVAYFPDYAETLANIIKPLHISVNVEITNQSIKDSVVRGVVITHSHSQNPREELDIIFRALAALPNPPEQPRLILIDSLDQAVTFSDRNNLIDLLTRLGDLPPWIRFILTSRPDDRVLRAFESLKPYQIRAMAAQNLNDIQEYAERRIEQPPLQNQLIEGTVTSQFIIDKIVKLSSGNFLYANVLLNDIETGLQSLTNLSALSKTISEIYRYELSRISSEKDWIEYHEHIFGVLAVAQEPISKEQIRVFVNPEIDSWDLRDSMMIIRQYLDIKMNEQQEETYTIFHQAFRDYLLDENYNLFFQINANKQHGLISDYYLSEIF